MVWQFKGCPACGGVESECPECKGSNVVSVRRCPRAMVRDGNVSALLPFFWDYQQDRRCWPDGRGRMFQPVKLSKAFQLMQKYVSERPTGG